MVPSVREARMHGALGEVATLKAATDGLHSSLVACVAQREEKGLGN